MAPKWPPEWAENGTVRRMPTRERNAAILNAVREKPRTVSEIVEATGIAESTVKRGVRELEEQSLIRHDDDGTYFAKAAPAPEISDADLQNAIESYGRLLGLVTQNEKLVRILAKLNEAEIKANEL